MWINSALRDQRQDFFQVSDLTTVRENDAQSLPDTYLHVYGVLKVECSNTDYLSGETNLGDG